MRSVLRGSISIVIVMAMAAIRLSPRAEAAPLAVTSTWTNANGGAWSDPANWSHGVPLPGDLAILPGFGSPAGYVISVSGTAATGVVQVGGNGANVRFVGGGTLTAIGGCYVGVNGPGELGIGGVSMNVVGPTSVGGAFGNATLKIGTGGTFTTSTLAIEGGAGGAGVLTLVEADAVLFTSTTATIGTTGAGLLTIAEGATLAAGSLTFGTQASTVLTVVEGDSAPIQLFGPLKRGGLITVLLDDLYQPIANEQVPIIASPGPLNGQWFAQSLPEVYGEPTVFVPTALGELLQIPDPVVNVILQPNPIVVSVGYAVEVDVYLQRLSGALDLLCCDEKTTETVGLQAWQGSGHFTITDTDPITIFGDEAGLATLTAVYSEPDPSISGSATVLIEESTPAEVRRVSETALGVEGSLDTPSLSPQLSVNTFRVSPDGRHVLFTSCAPEFLPASGVGPCQLYLKDLQSGSLEVVSIGLPGDFAANGQFIGADMSDDLRFVVFATNATNMAENSPPAGTTQIYLRDRLLGTTEIVSGVNNGASFFYGNLGSYFPRITADGSAVYFASDLTNFATAGLNGSKRDVLRWDRVTETLAMVSNAPGVVSLNLPSDLPACSADGRYVAFVTAAPNALPRGMEGLPILPRIYVKDMLTGSLTLASVATDGTPGNGASNRPSLDASGRLLAFDSLSTNLGAGASAVGRVWVRDLESGVTSLVDVSQGADGLSGTTSAPALSADGRYVALSARADSNPDFPLVQSGIFRVRLSSGEALRVARSPVGTPLLDCYAGTAISADGRTILFATAFASLVPFDLNERIDIFARIVPPLREDLDGDGLVGPLDLAILLGSWGQTDPVADLNDDGTVGAADLALLLGAWG